MPQLGASRITAAYSTNGLSDASGIPLISSSNDFTASPLGIAARSQALYGIANAQFDLLPEDPTATIADNENPLPYWSVMNYSDGRIVPLSYYDTATGTYSVELNPTAGSASDYIEVKTRSYLLTDDNLGLRQKAYLTMGKGTAYAGTTQFNVVLNAEYFDVNGTSLSSYAVGTALDNTAMTSITGITTSGSAAISAAAAYVDFTIKLSATATVTSGVKVYLKSFFIQTSQAASGGSFLITETFNSSGTWTRPTGVDYVTVVALGGGQAGQGGYLTAGTASSVVVAGGNGGKSGSWALIRDIALGTATSVSVGVGAGGAAGTALTFTKAAAGTTTSTQSPPTPASGGATTFGSYISVPGGGAGAFSFGFLSLGGGTAGETQDGNGAVAGTEKNGGKSTLSAFTMGVPFTTFVATGAAGAAGSGSGGSSGTASSGGAAQSVNGIAGGGGGGGNGTAASSPSVSAGGTGGAGGAGSGGGAAFRRTAALTQTIVVTGGAGGTAVANTGSGGGGGGAVGVAASSAANYNSAAITANSGKGGDGAAGFVTVIWVG
jgi:hypothetical protein